MGQAERHRGPKRLWIVPRCSPASSGYGGIIGGILEILNADIGGYPCLNG